MWPNLQETVEEIFEEIAEEILNGKLHSFAVSLS